MLTAKVPPQSDTQIAKRADQENGCQDPTHFVTYLLLQTKLMQGWATLKSKPAVKMVIFTVKDESKDAIFQYYQQ